MRQISSRPLGDGSQWLDYSLPLFGLGVGWDGERLIDCDPVLIDNLISRSTTPVQMASALGSRAVHFPPHRPILMRGGFQLSGATCGFGWGPTDTLMFARVFVFFFFLNFFFRMSAFGL